MQGGTGQRQSFAARLISALLPGHVRSDIPISPPPSWKKVSSLPPSPSGRRMETAIKSSVESILGLEHMSHGAMAGQYGPGLVPAGPDPGRREQPNPLGRRRSALCRRCVRNMHARTPSTNCQRLVADREHSGFLFRGPPAKQAREKGADASGKAKCELSPSSDTRAIGMPPSRRRSQRDP